MGTTSVLNLTRKVGHDNLEKVREVGYLEIRIDKGSGSDEGVCKTNSDIGRSLQVLSGELCGRRKLENCVSLKGTVL